MTATVIFWLTIICVSLVLMHEPTVPDEPHPDEDDDGYGDTWG